MSWKISKLEYSRFDFDNFIARWVFRELIFSKSTKAIHTEFRPYSPTNGLPDLSEVLQYYFHKIYFHIFIICIMSYLFNKHTDCASLTVYYRSGVSIFLCPSRFNDRLSLLLLYCSTV